MNMLPEFDLTWQWRAAPGRRSPELDATWAQLRIAVGSDPVTLVHEPDTGTYRDHITVSLYPLAEWIAYNWWSLIADARPGTQISQLRGAYRNGVGDERGPWWVRSRRHTMRAAGDGFRWPDVLFVSEGMLTRVVWIPDTGTDPRQDMRFTGRGNATVPSDALQQTLMEFVDAVVARLAEQGVTETPLATEWTAVRGASGAEAAFCRRAAQLGLDPYRDADVHADDITSARRRLPAHLADDFFNGVSPERVHDQLAWLDKANTIAATDTDPAASPPSNGSPAGRTANGYTARGTVSTIGTTNGGTDQGNASQGSTSEDNATHSGTSQGGTSQGGAGQNNASQGNATQDNTTQDNATHSSAGQGRASQGDVPNHAANSDTGIGAVPSIGAIGGNAREGGGPGPVVRAAVLAELREVCADITDRFYDPDVFDNPWELGFATAQRVRSYLGVADTAEFDPGDYLAYHTEPVPYLDRGLVAFGTRSGQHGPAVVSTRVFTRRPRRFLLARALWHVLCDRNDTFLIVASHTHRQHIARGFALELLAPAHGIATMLADPEHLVSSEDVEVISDHYGVGNIVVEHQLDNRVLAMDFDWQDNNPATPAPHRPALRQPALH